MRIILSEKYLWLPVNPDMPEVKLHFYVDGQKVQEADVCLGDETGPLFAAMDVQVYHGKEMTIRCEKPVCALCRAYPPENQYAFRPQLHFTPPFGWHNDPNGLLFADGVWHMYYQWNPYGVKWGNMHWGHAISHDLVRWEHRPVALCPDEYGTIFSGCGFRDRENAAGCGKDAYLFFYTASGGDNAWSKEAGQRYTQRLAASTDGGETLVKREGAVLPHITGSNRDPKVFWHPESKAYVMILYLEENRFALFRSQDLLHWHQTQQLQGEGMWECPDLIRLPVENEPGTEKWVFWSADGYYRVGRFDGHCFTPEGDVQKAYLNKLPYAAQTYAGVEDRVITVSWLRMENARGNYRGVMAFPARMRLAKDGDGYRLRLQPVKELDACRKERQTLQQVDRLEKPLQGTAAEAAFMWPRGSRGKAKIQVGQNCIMVDFDRGEMQASPFAGDAFSASFDPAQPFDLTLLMDQEVIELYALEGRLYGAMETEENLLAASLKMEGTAGTVSITQLGKE